VHSEVAVGLEGLMWGATLAVGGVVVALDGGFQLQRQVDGSQFGSCFAEYDDIRVDGVDEAEVDLVLEVHDGPAKESCRDGERVAAENTVQESAADVLGTIREAARANRYSSY
jgi:hypothetical protein